MKYTVEGFSQKYLIQYGLDEKDALILRYFIDFKDSGNMKMKIINKVPYYWLKGGALLEQLPILKITNIDVLRRRLKKMTSCGILMHEHVLEGGSYAFYAIGPNYENLLSYDDLSESVEDNNETIKAEATLKKEPNITKSEGSDLLVGAKDYSINKSINNNINTVGDKAHTEKQKLELEKSNCKNDEISISDSKEMKEEKVKDKSWTPYDEIIKMFNDTCISFPKVKVRNKTRDNLMRKMYKNLGMENVSAVFEMAERSDYLSGRNGKWQNCSFDWLIKENNYIKVLEGNYNRYSNKQTREEHEEKAYLEIGEPKEIHCEEEDDNDSGQCEFKINTELLEDL